MADVQYWRDSIISEIEQIRGLTSSIPNQSGDLERNATIDQAEKKVRNAKGNCRSLKAEIRIVADPEESSRYRKELTSYEQTLSQLTADIQGLKSNESRNQLFLGAETNGFNSPEQADPVQAGDALLDGAENIQDKTQVALNNTVNMIQESKATGMMTLAELERQGNQINEVETNVIRLEDNLNRADRLIKTFGKRMATDKLIQAFACVNILLIVGVVIYSIVKGGLQGDTGEGSPESPVDDQNDRTDTARMLSGFWQ
jgi:SNARE protein